MGMKVSEVARLAGVSVKALHHYDALGLVRPSDRTAAGYRLYSDADLLRLQQVLFFKALGLPLEEIGRMLADPAFDVKAALLAQKRALTEESARVNALIRAVESALEAHERGIAMNKEEMFEVFGEFDPTQHEAEVKERWGDSDAFRESKKRTARYNKEDWLRIKAEGEAVTLKLVALMSAGQPASSAEAMDVAEEHRRHIDRWFYPLSHAFHCELGKMYVADERFTKNIDAVRPGLAAYWRDAIFANAARQKP
jgi:DNA-binding transcriptional MerR regulator